MDVAIATSQNCDKTLLVGRELPELSHDNIARLSIASYSLSTIRGDTVHKLELHVNVKLKH